MSQRRVLLIERDVEVAQAVLGFLAAGGDVAEQAADAGGLLNGGDLPDVVMVRAELPGPEGSAEGCAVADGIKGAEPTQGLPVVVYSSDPATVESHRAGASPADAYLAWPFSADALLDQIHLLTDGAALAAPMASPEAGDEHLIAEEEVPPDGELEELFNTPLPAPGEPPPAAMGSEEPTVSMPDLPEISPELIQPIEAGPPPVEAPAAVEEEPPQSTPLPDTDNLARTMYDPLAVGLQPDQESTPDEPTPAPALQAADAELQELVDGLDAAALESTKEIPAVDDAALDALAEEAILPLPGASDPEPELTPAPDTIMQADPPSLDAAVDAEFGAALPPPPPPGPPAPAAAPAAIADTTLDSVPSPTPPPAEAIHAHNAQMEAALEAAGQAARAAKEQAEAARTQVEEIAAKLGSAKEEAASERARAAGLLESLESERARAAAMEQDVQRLHKEVAQLKADAEATAQARHTEAQRAASQAAQVTELAQQTQADAAVFERVTKAVRIAAALLEERSRKS